MVQNKLWIAVSAALALLSPRPASAVDTAEQLPPTALEILRAANEDDTIDGWLAFGTVLFSGDEDLIAYDNGRTIVNAGEDPARVILDGSVYDVPAWGVIVLRGGTGSGAKSCSVTCGLVDGVQWFSCCLQGENGYQCICREPTASFIDCNVAGGRGSTQCSSAG